VFSSWSASWKVSPSLARQAPPGFIRVELPGVFPSGCGRFACFPDTMHSTVVLRCLSLANDEKKNKLFFSFFFLRTLYGDFAWDKGVVFKGVTKQSVTHVRDSLREELRKTSKIPKEVGKNQ
jgi:hypothetical protein